MTTKRITKETGKAAVETAVSAGTTAGSAGAGAGGIFLGAAGGEAVSRVLDRRDRKAFIRNRMIRLFVTKLRQEEHQDSIGKAFRDIVRFRFTLLVKRLAGYAGLFLLALFSLVALVLLPVIALIAVVYNSPFAIWFPSISSAETTQQVLSAYVAEWEEEIETELEQLEGCDRSEAVYGNTTEQGIPDNYCDILAVYMVKHGNGDTATDMTEQAKRNLKQIFQDMCQYNVTSGEEAGIDEAGNPTSRTVKYVHITLKHYQQMEALYGFSAEEQELLAELMKPEHLAMLKPEGSVNGGQEIPSEQYQAIVDAISNANGKKVVEFALSKVGYPYSQELRDSGTHYDCSSLAYYAWQSAGVNLSYQGSNTAASEGKLCYDRQWLVREEEMQPGDLIFFSYGPNGRFLDIGHVAIYAGDGKVVEAASTRLGVVYRPLQGKSSIVMIGRPR